MSFTGPTPAELLGFHYACLQGTYFDECIRLESGVLLFSERIADPYYNFYAPASPASGVDLPTEVEHYFKEQGRQPVLYATPLNRLADDPGPLETWAQDAWLVARVDALETDADRADRGVQGLSLRLVYGGDRDAYVATFAQAYEGGGADDPYGELDPSYAESLRASFDASVPGFRAYYLQADVDGVPAGVAAMYTAGGLAGVYGVGTVPAQRRRGVGGTMMAELARLAAGDGVGHVFLQTEAGSAVQAWYEAMGYELRFVARYLTFPR